MLFKRPTSLRYVPFACAAAFLLAACGGDDDVASDPTQPISAKVQGGRPSRRERAAPTHARVVSQGGRGRRGRDRADLVSTRDGVLVARHENEISGTTNVSTLPQFASRKATKTIGAGADGLVHRGFHARRAEDAARRERIPQVRPRTPRTTTSSRSRRSTRSSRSRSRCRADRPHDPPVSGNQASDLLPVDRPAARGPSRRCAAEGFVHGTHGDRLHPVVRGREPEDDPQPDQVEPAELEARAADGRSRPAPVRLREGERQAPMATCRRATACARSRPMRTASARTRRRSSRSPRTARCGSRRRTCATRTRPALVVHPYTFRPENNFLPASLKDGGTPATHHRQPARCARSRRTCARASTVSSPTIRPSAARPSIRSSADRRADQDA